MDLNGATNIPDHICISDDPGATDDDLHDDYVGMRLSY